jgi:RNA polymerase sigma factor (sigma-70 family)
MADERPFLTAETIRAESGWLRRLAAALVRDGDGAEDALQETWLIGLAHPPSAAGPAGGWLRVVLGNVARKRARGERRRQTRERDPAVAVSDTPSSEELVVRMEAQRLVADLVAGLAEPYRSTILLCYYEGLPRAEVARRLAIPAATVRWRLSRALATLRAQLEQRDEPGRKSWRAVLIPLAAGKPGHFSGWGKVMMAMTGSSKVMLGAAALLIAALGVVATLAPRADGTRRDDFPPPSQPTGTSPAAARSNDRRPAPETEASGRAKPAANAGARVLVPRFAAVASDAGARARGTAPAAIASDKETMRLALRTRMRETADRVKICMQRWATVDEGLRQGVRLSVLVDERGLDDVWLEGRSDVPQGSLSCVSEAVYQTDWSGITSAPLKTSFVVRYERTDGGPP